MDVFPSADAWRARVKRIMVENSITMAEIGRMLHLSRQWVFQILQPGRPLKSRDETRIMSALEDIMVDRYMSLGRALGKRKPRRYAEIAAARVALEEAAEQGTTPWETVKAELLNNA